MQSYSAFVEALSCTEPDLATVFRRFTGIRSVLDWMEHHFSPRQTLKDGFGSEKVGVVDIVGQDEFHYDFLVHWERGRWIAFGVT